VRCLAVSRSARWAVVSPAVSRGVLSPAGLPVPASAGAVRPLALRRLPMCRDYREAASGSVEAWDFSHMGHGAY